MRNCFVPGCNIKQKDKKRNLFRPPKDKELFAKWENALPKKRSLRPTDLVCCLHFRPEDVITTFDHQVNGKIYQLERDRPRLRPNAIPALNIPSMEDLLLIECRRPKKEIEGQNSTQIPITKNSPLVQQNNKEKSLCTESNEHDQIAFDASNGELLEIESLVQEEFTSPNCLSHQNQVNNIDNDFIATTSNEEMGIKQRDLIEHSEFDNLYDNVYELVVVPNVLWGIHRCPKRSVILFTYMNIEKMSPTKILAVYSNGDVEKILCSNVIEIFNVGNDPQLYKKVGDLLANLDETRICKGDINTADCEIEIKVSECQTMDQMDYCRNCVIAAAVEEAIEYNEEEFDEITEYI